MATILLVDASGLLYAAYHAIRVMTNKDGLSTNALFGFVHSLLKVLKTHPVDSIAVIFDGHGNIDSRRLLDTSYKAHRVDTAEDLYPQIGWAQEFCRLYGMPYLALPGVEADDVIASVATQAVDRGYEVLICSNDKDLSQLVGDHVRLVVPRRDYALVDAAAIEERYGLPPSLMADYLALVGDTSDNIIGVSGIGPKTAAAALKAAGNLEALLANPALIKSPAREKALLESIDRVRLNRRLVALDSALAFEEAPGFFTPQTQDIEGLRLFYRTYDLHSLLRALPTATYSDTANGSLAETISTPTDYRLIENEDEWQNLVDKLCDEDLPIAIATATTADHKPVGLAVAAKPFQAYYIPLQGTIERESLVNGIRKLLQAVPIYGHDIKALCHSLHTFDATLPLPHISGDLLLASQLLYAHQRIHDLPHLLLEKLEYPLTTVEEHLGDKKADLANTFPSLLTPYFCRYVDGIVRLKPLLDNELAARGLTALYTEIELELLPILTAMEKQGIYLDTAVLTEFAHELAGQISSLVRDIHALAGVTFNVNSPQQLAQVLTACGIKTGKKTVHGTSTSADELIKVSHKHPIIPLILQYRELEKLRSTYVEALPRAVNPSTQRIHCTFNQAATATGRLSCQYPNLQNIPIRTALGRRVRSAFRPEDASWSFLAADYSQIELRLLAHLSGDAALVRAFDLGEDIHRYTASLIFQIPLADVTAEQRARTKAVNFGIIYGQQAYGLAQELSIDVKEAERFIQAYFERYPTVKTYLDASKESARTTGKTVTLSGRERTIPEISSKNGAFRAAAERLAVNSPLQGSAADLIKIAMKGVVDALVATGSKARLLLQIHDELLFEVPDEEVDSLKILITKVMEEAMPLRVPLVVNISIGKNWQEC